MQPAHRVLRRFGFLSGRSLSTAKTKRTKKVKALCAGDPGAKYAGAEVG
jgi:hypothetical protein